MPFVFAHIQLHPGKVERFTEMLENVAPILANVAGWKLQGSYVNNIGRIGSVIDVWEVPDANSVETLFEKLGNDPEFQKWAPVVEECVESETLQLMAKLPV